MVRNHPNLTIACERCGQSALGRYCEHCRETMGAMLTDAAKAVRAEDKGKGHEVFAIEYLEHRWAYLVRDGDAFWPVLERNNKKYMPIHDRAMPLDDAEGVAESILDLLDTRYVEKEAEWRKLPMTPKQRDVLAKYRIESDDTWIRGDAADALGERFAKRHVKDMLERLDFAAWQAAFQKPQVQAWLQAKLAAFRAYGEQRAPSVVG